MVALVAVFSEDDETALVLDFDEEVVRPLEVVMTLLVVLAEVVGAFVVNLEAEVVR